MDLIELQNRAATCSLCDLHVNRETPVFAKGSSKAKIMICGMCPGRDENSSNNKLGVPFIGRAGKLLDEILKDTNLTQDDVYITNVVKCFLKPGIRLTDEWIDSCLPYLIGQIGAIEPKVILALGADAGRALLDKPMSASLASMRGKKHKFLGGINIIVTYHPSYFLRKGGKSHDHYSRIIDDITLAKSVLIGDEILPF
jgi:DNA polymerase